MLPPYSNGKAQLICKNTGEMYSIDGEDLDWEEVSEWWDYSAGVIYQATVDHPTLGRLTWKLWENIDGGVENRRESNLNGHEVISDINYGLHGSYWDAYNELYYDSEHDDSWIDREIEKREIVDWFFRNYEDPTASDPFYQKEDNHYTDANQVDVRAIIAAHFSGADSNIINEAVEEIASQGANWIPIPADGGGERDLYVDIDWPTEQEPGVNFTVAPNGLIDIVPTGTIDNDVDKQISVICDVILQACTDLSKALNGTNAYASIADTANQYRLALSASPKSLDLIFSLGVRLESARARLQREIDSGDYPEMAVSAGEALDSILALHGPMIYSTERGRMLLENALSYAKTTDVTSAFKQTSMNFAAAICQANDVVSDYARKIVFEVNSDIGEGAHPGRSAAVANTTNRNLLITISWAAVGYAAAGAIGNGFTASIPGTLLANAVQDASNVYWHFLESNYSLLRELVAVSGPDLSWFASVINWVRSKIPSAPKGQ